MKNCLFRSGGRGAHPYGVCSNLIDSNRRKFTEKLSFCSLVVPPHCPLCVILSGESGSGDASRFAVEPRRGAEANRVAISRRDLLESEAQCSHRKGAPSFVDPAPLPFRALPWVGFDYEKHHPVVFFSAQDDTRGEVWRRILTALHSKTSPYSTIGERLWVKTASR